MQNLMKLSACIVLFLATSIAWAQETMTEPAPSFPEGAHETIALVSDQLLGMIEESKKKFKTNPDGFYSDIEEVIAPWMNFRVWGRAVMGPEFYSKTTDEQRVEFSAVFKDSLIETYAKGMLGVDDSGYKIDPPHPKDRNAKSVKVSQELYSKQDRVRVIYLMSRDSDGRWVVRNVSFGGVDLGRTFRNQFKRAVEEYDRDFDQVIANWAAEG